VGAIFKESQRYPDRKKINERFKKRNEFLLIPLTDLKRTQSSHPIKTRRERLIII
jgi:hypothetical protein